MSYNIIQYGKMINDDTRTKSYARSLKKLINNNSIVMDIGTGTGIFALLASKFGARKVYALETSPVIDIARKIAIENNMSDRIEYIQDTRNEVVLPEKVNIIVCDMRGSLPLHKNNIRVIINARDRYLKRNGFIIPSIDRLYGALVQDNNLYEDYRKPWLMNQYNLDMSAASKFATNVITKKYFQHSQLLTTRKKLAEIDYLKIDEEYINTEIIFKCKKSGTTHGFIIWFDAELLKGINYSNAPGKKELIYGGQMFYPFTYPVKLIVDDVIKLHIMAKNINGQYVWTWNTQFLDKSKNYVKASYTQSTFYSSPITKDSLRKLSGKFIPKLDNKGKHILETLNLFGEKSIEDISNIIFKKYPHDFKSLEKTLEFVRDISFKYSSN